MENFNKQTGRSNETEEGYFAMNDHNAEQLGASLKAVFDGIYAGIFKPEYYKDVHGQERVRVKNDKGEILYEDSEGEFHKIAEGENLYRDSQVFSETDTMDQ